MLIQLISRFFEGHTGVTLPRKQMAGALQRGIHYRQACMVARCELFKVSSSQRSYSKNKHRSHWDTFIIIHITETFIYKNFSQDITINNLTYCTAVDTNHWHSCHHQVGMSLFNETFTSNIQCFASFKYHDRESKQEREKESVHGEKERYMESARYN